MTKYQKLALTAAIAVAIAALFALLAFGLANREPATGRSGETRVGKPAPDFSMTLLDGGSFALADYAGTPLVINFWASWCPPCRNESPGFERIWRQYQDEGVQFVGVDIQDTEPEAVAYVQEFDLTFPNGRDPDGDITVDYGVIGLPVTFFINADGLVEGRWVGAIPEDKLESWVRALISESSPTLDTESQTPDDFFPLR